MTMSQNTRVDRELSIRQRIRFHENEARIIESWLSHPKEVDKEIAELEKRLTDLTAQLATMRERKQGLSRELLEQHKADAQAAQRELVLLTKSEELAQVAELMKKLQAAGLKLEDVVK